MPLLVPRWPTHTIMLAPGSYSECWGKLGPCVLLLFEPFVHWAVGVLGAAGWREVSDFWCSEVAENVAAFWSPNCWTCMLIGWCSFWTCFHQMGSFQTCFEFIALVPSAITGNVCLKSPASTTVTPPMSMLLSQISLRERSTASSAPWCDIVHSSQTISCTFFSTSAITEPFEMLETGETNWKWSEVFYCVTVYPCPQLWNEHTGSTECPLHLHRWEWAPQKWKRRIICCMLLHLYSRLID